MKVTKEQIIIKALEFFSKHDYESSSLNSIAKGIGITKGGIYHYFESKDELFRAAINHMIDLVLHFYQSIPVGELGPEELIDQLLSFDDIFKIMQENLNVSVVESYMEYYYLVFTGVKKFPEIKKRVAELYMDMMQAVSGSLLVAQSKGLVKKDVDPQAEAFGLISLVEGGMLISEIHDLSDPLKYSGSLAKSIKKRVLV